MRPPKASELAPVSAPDSSLPPAQNKSVPPDKPPITQAEIDRRFDSLLKHVQANRPNEDVSLIRKAWDFCVRHHEGQMRASGEPYIIHPLEVAEVLAEMKLDSTAIAAALLHDAVEDTPATSEEIEAGFGDQVAHIVEGVTKIDKIQFANREDRQAENVRKMLLAMVSDVRVVLIKLADRLHNMRTLEHLKPDRQEAIARETLDIYAPLAHRLGMGKVRGELEDLAFRYTDPVSYERVSAAVEARRIEGEQFLRSVEDTLTEQLRENGHPGPRGVAHQAALFHLPEDRARQSHLRPGLRSAGHPRHHPGRGLLLRGLRPHPHAVAAGAGAHQGLHRHAPRQPLPVAAHHGHGRQRPPVRSADPHRRDAPHRRGRHRRALEVQGRRMPPSPPATRSG